MSHEVCSVSCYEVCSVSCYEVFSVSCYEVRISASHLFPFVLSRNEFCKFMAAGFSLLGKTTHGIMRENISFVFLCFCFSLTSSVCC